MQAVLWGVAGLLCVNAATYVAFVYDKYSARRQARRVSEATLLQLAFWGGSPAAKLAQVRLRHKTRKQPFGRRLNRIVRLHVFLLIAVPVLTWSPGARQALADGLRGVLP